MSTDNFNPIFNIMNFNVQTYLVLTNPEDECTLQGFDGYSSGSPVYFKIKDFSYNLSRVHQGFITSSFIKINTFVEIFLFQK